MASRAARHQASEHAHKEAAVNEGKPPPLSPSGSSTCCFLGAAEKVREFDRPLCVNVKLHHNYTHQAKRLHQRLLRDNQCFQPDVHTPSVLGGRSANNRRGGRRQAGKKNIASSEKRVKEDSRERKSLKCLRAPQSW